MGSVNPGTLFSSDPSSSSKVAPTVQSFTSTGSQSGVLFYVSSANATVGAVYTNNGASFTVTKTISPNTLLFTSGTGTPLTSGTLTKSSGTGDSTITFSAFQPTATYTPTASTILYIEVTMVGAGGAGGGYSGGAYNGGAGGNTVFSSLLMANGGSGGYGLTQSTPSGGSTSISGGSTVENMSGSPGNQGSFASSGSGGSGGSSPFGGAGAGGSSNNVGTSASGNSGSGGGGGSTSNANSCSGGGSGGYIKSIISGSTLSTIISSGAAYAIGTGGVGSNGGGAGANGYLVIKEFYQ